MALLASVLALGAALVVSTAATAAFAASLQIAPGSQFRFIRAEPRANYPFWISRQDCLDDEKHAGGGAYIEVQPNLSPVGNYSFQVWVSRGADCTDPQVRNVQNTCWRVFDTLAQINNQTYELSPREILAEGVNPGAPETCDKEVEWSTTLYFLLLNGDELLANLKWNETQIDTKAPAAPISLNAYGGDAALFLNWEVSTTPVLDGQGFGFFCAAGGTDTGTGLGGQGGAGCSAPGLTEGAFPSPEQRCGQANSVSNRNGVTSSPADDSRSEVEIVNGQSYGVSVASMDRVGNVGRLSTVACATPEPVTTFFEHYREVGGRGGGGFCAAQPGRTAPAFLLGGLLSALFVVLFRRNRRGASS